MAVSLKRGLVRTGAVIALVCPCSARSEAAPEPPTSLEPNKDKQKIEVSYVHRRVRACTPIPAHSPKACSAQTSDTGVATSVAFEPLSVRAGAPSPISRVLVSFSDAPGPQQQIVELSVGEWAIEWPGCPDAGRLTIAADSPTTPSVALRTLSGRCELSRSGCNLVADALEQRVTIGR